MGLLAENIWKWSHEVGMSLYHTHLDNQENNFVSDLVPLFLSLTVTWLGCAAQYERRSV